MYMESTRILYSKTHTNMTDHVNILGRDYIGLFFPLPTLAFFLHLMIIVSVLQNSGNVCVHELYAPINAPRITTKDRSIILATSGCLPQLGHICVIKAR